MRHHLDLALSLLLNRHDIAQISHPSVDLDLVVQKLLKGSDVEDLVRGRLRGIDNELPSPPSAPRSATQKIPGRPEQRNFPRRPKCAGTSGVREIIRGTYLVSDLALDVLALRARRLLYHSPLSLLFLQRPAHCLRLI